MDSEIYAGQFLRPSCLSTVEYLRFCEVLQIVVIREHLYWVFRSFTIPSPVFEGVHNS